MSAQRLAGVLSATLMLCACGDSDDVSSAYDLTIPTSPASGKIHAKDFLFGGGHARIDQTKGAISLRLGDRETACSAPPSGLEVIFEVPSTTPTTYDLSMHLEDRRTVTLYDPADGANVNYVCTHGRVQISEVATDRVTGGLNVYFYGEEADWSVKGTFSASVCP